MKQLLWALPQIHHLSAIVISHFSHFSLKQNGCFTGDVWDQLLWRETIPQLWSPRLRNFSWLDFPSFTFILRLIGSSWVQPWGLFRGRQKMSHTRQPGISLSTCIRQAKWVTMCMLTYLKKKSLEAAIYVVDSLCWLTHSFFLP